MANGVTSKGFIRPRLPEIRDNIEAKIKSNLSHAGFSDDIETAPNSIMGILIDTFADVEAAMWESAEGVYYTMYPSSASDSALDRAVSFSGMTRLQPERSRCNGVFYGSTSTVVPKHTQIRNHKTSTIWRSTENVTISTAAAADVFIIPKEVKDEDYTVTLNSTSYSYSNSGGNLQDILNGLQSSMSGVDKMSLTMVSILEYPVESKTSMSASEST